MLQLFHPSVAHHLDLLSNQHLYLRTFALGGPVSPAVGAFIAALLSVGEKKSKRLEEQSASESTFMRQTIKL